MPVQLVLDPREAPAAVLAASAVLARAFRDNPLNLKVIRGGPRRRERANRAGLRALLEGAPPGIPRWLGGDPVQAALVAIPPGEFPLPPARVSLQLACLFAQGFGVMRRWGELFEALSVLHPAEPHWYLTVLGVDPPAQGRGHGTRLLDALLARVDAEGVPRATYLETDRDENVGWYGRRGFRVIGEERLMGCSVYRMLRAPRGEANARPA